MSGSPQPRDEPWYDDELEDYRHAKNDDECRQMLLIFGVDNAHQREAERLFNPPDADGNPEGAGIDPLLSELQKLRKDFDQYRSDYAPYQTAEEHRAKVSECKGPPQGVIAALITTIIVSLVVDYWKNIVSFLMDLI